MRIKESLKDLGLCIGYFAVGASYLAIYQKLDGTVLRSAVEFLSLLATISAAVFAMFTLNAWKRQFSHSEGYAALTRLIRAVDELLIESVYIRNVPQYAQARTLDDEEPMKAELLENERQSFSDWSEAYGAFRNDLDDVVVFVKPKLLTGYLAEPARLWERFITIRDEIEHSIMLADKKTVGPVFFKAVLRSKSFETELLNVKKTAQQIRADLMR